MKAGNSFFFKYRNFTAVGAQKTQQPVRFGCQLQSQPLLAMTKAKCVSCSISRTPPATKPQYSEERVAIFHLLSSQDKLTLPKVQGSPQRRNIFMKAESLVDKQNFGNESSGTKFHANKQAKQIFRRLQHTRRMSCISGGFEHTSDIAGVHSEQCKPKQIFWSLDS